MLESFDPSWLRLREPADHAALNRDVLAALAGYFDSQGEIGIIDLGCGTGSNLRALYRCLPPLQRWRLVDGSLEMIEEARRLLLQWADHATEADGRLSLRKDGHTLLVEFTIADLSAPSADWVEFPADLVTAAALLDLVSDAWLDGLAQLLSAWRLPFHATLTYDGAMRFDPPEDEDALILSAFNRDQKRDKGFGTALGPAAVDAAVGAFARRAYSVVTGPSPWHLEREDSALLIALTLGIGMAAAGALPAGGHLAATWIERRRSTQCCMIGHRDIFAAPLVSE